MALTVQRQGTGQESRIDRMLHVAAVEWFGLPEKLDRFHELDKLDQMDFLVEWPLVEDRLERLAEYADGGEMNADQYGLFEAVLRMVFSLEDRLGRLFVEHEMDGHWDMSKLPRVS